MWIAATIFSYLLFALGSLIDRFILTKKKLKSSTYAFFVGLLGLIFAAALPLLWKFVPPRPQPQTVLLALTAGFVWITAVFLAYKAIKKSEVSRASPTIGAFLPILSLLFSFLFYSQKPVLALPHFGAFFLLTSGGVIISLEKKKEGIKMENLKRGGLAALAFALGFLLMKKTYLKAGFLWGFVLMRAGGVLASLLFLTFKETRGQILNKKKKKRKTSFFVIGGQIITGVAFLLQNYAVFEAHFSQVPVINALEGVRYAFLFLFVFLLEKTKPDILKEDMEGAAIIQKSIGILLIWGGLILLTL